MHNDFLVLALRGGEFTAPLHLATISSDGRWLRVRTESLTPVSGQIPDEPIVAVSATSYGRSWAVVAHGAVIGSVEQALQIIRTAQPAMALAERLLAGLQPAQVPAPEPAAGDDLDDDD